MKHQNLKRLNVLCVIEASVDIRFNKLLQIVHWEFKFKGISIKFPREWTKTLVSGRE